ncbi:isoprene synthase, chloroplastic-like [Senna tora]|uniref:Isoprene synthase, chloroplastic-like n=1 Tax=Senna tora TaxID=362788 RepID=A0A834TJ40_9FABA|nr:isoprene synthase, chloroplastic-like [Senna tora]
MIHRTEESPMSLVELIDNIQRLGLTYKFEEDINTALHKVVSSQNRKHKTEKTLHSTSLTFRLLRQHGFHISQDVFKNFMDKNGKFKAEIRYDVEGLLSLYEASHLVLEGENILDEARVFATTHLNNYLKQNSRTELDNKLEEQVSHVLELPYHQRMHRLEARYYIETYRKNQSHDELLLELAILDFNMVQSLYQQELRAMSRWWNEIGLAKKLSFARDRLMESFFWALGMAPNPQFSKCREELTKVAAFITVIDDVYDVYGTLDELELFTDAVQRWDVKAINSLPDYMKLCFLALYNTVNDMAYDTLKEQGQNSLPYLTKAWSDLCKTFLQEAKWNYKREIPPKFEEYLENAWVSSSGPLFLTHSYFLLTPHFKHQPLPSLLSNNYHNLLRSPSIIFRLCNDLATSADEVERGETTNSMASYMRDRGVSEEEAREELRNMNDRAWKKMNREGVVEGSEFPKPFVETAMNLARISQCTYQYGDGHGKPDGRSKNRIKSLLVDPIPLPNVYHLSCN